jgi:uncharacterized small protein (TIGR04563 family)
VGRSGWVAVCPRSRSRWRVGRPLGSCRQRHKRDFHNDFRRCFTARRMLLRWPRVGATPPKKDFAPVAENETNKGSDKRKQSLYFPEAMLQEIKDEAARLDRSLSWVVQRAWKMARLDIKKIPSVNDVEDDTEAG